MNYKRLSECERDLIGKMLYAGKSVRFISNELLRSHSTISREIIKYTPALAPKCEARLHAPKPAPENAEPSDRSSKALSGQGVRSLGAGFG